MTIAMSSRTSWREVEPQFSVAQVDGEFAGTVERRGDRFHAVSGTGVVLGDFRTADGAQRAIERAVEERSRAAAPVRTEHATSALIALGLAAALVAALGAVVTL